MPGAADHRVHMRQNGLIISVKLYLRSSCATLKCVICVPYEMRAGDWFKRALQLTPSLSRLQSKSRQWRLASSLKRTSTTH